MQSGDSLARIAALFNSTEEDIIKENNITDPNAIQVGQLLIIPVNMVTPTATRPPTSTPITPGTTGTSTSPHNHALHQSQSKSTGQIYSHHVKYSAVKKNSNFWRKTLANIKSQIKRNRQNEKNRVQQSQLSVAQLVLPSPPLAPLLQRMIPKQKKLS